jgi:hypothetical protein
MIQEFSLFIFNYHTQILQKKSVIEKNRVIKAIKCWIGLSPRVRFMSSYGKTHTHRQARGREREWIKTSTTIDIYLQFPCQNIKRCWARELEQKVSLIRWPPRKYARAFYYSIWFYFICCQRQYLIAKRMD